jgi:hypothetical protein
MLLLAGCAQQVQVKPDVAAMPDARRPVSEAAAQKAAISYIATAWLKDPAPATFNFRPLTNGAVTLGYGLKESGWFMCGTVVQRAATNGDNKPRVFFAHFDREQPDIVDGAVDFTTGSGLVAHWCADVYGAGS